jgi:hypothetical protein
MRVRRFWLLPVAFAAVLIGLLASGLSGQVRPRSMRHGSLMGKAVPDRSAERPGE